MDQPASRLDTIDSVDEMDDAEEEIIVTRVQIEQTRAEMSDTIDAIKEKLSPPHLIQEAKESVQEAASNFTHQTVDRAKEAVSGAVDSARQAVGDVVDTAREKVGSAVDSARQVVAPAVETARQAVAPAVDTVRDTGSYLMDTIKQNPMPAALIGVGLGWLYMNQLNQTRKMNEMSQIGARAQQSAGQIADSTQRLFWENPLAVGAMALALGAGLGLAIPQTPQENRLLGDARDQLVDRAQQTAQEIGQKVQAVAGEALDSAKEEARHQGLAAG